MNKCGNISCECDVELLDQMCSDFCRTSDRGNAHDVRCGCGHDGCKSRIERELTGKQV